MKYAGILYDLHDIDVLRTKEHVYVTDRKKIPTSFSKIVRKNSTFFEKLSKKNTFPSTFWKSGRIFFRTFSEKVLENIFELFLPVTYARS